MELTAKDLLAKIGMMALQQDQLEDEVARLKAELAARDTVGEPGPEPG